MNIQTAEQYFERGNQFLNESKLSQAIHFYQQAIDLNSDNPWFYCKLGEACYLQNNLNQAKIAYDRAVELGKHQKVAYKEWFYYGLGVVLQKQGDLERAIANYQKAAELNPDVELFQEALKQLFVETTFVSKQNSDKSQQYQYNPNLIYDIGLHVGQDTEFYLKKGFQVIAIEANPLLVQKAQAKFQPYLESQQLQILNVGVDDKEGVFPFYVNESDSAWSSFVEEIGARGEKYHQIDIQCFPLEKIFLKYGVPYYMKVDIEGYDFKCILALKLIPIKPKYVSVENGNGGLLECLYSLGYHQFKFINQALVPQMKNSSPPREGNFAEHTFTFGASGLFGEETPGKWKNYADIAIEISNYWNNPDRDANIHGWFDLHAKLDLKD